MISDIFLLFVLAEADFFGGTAEDVDREGFLLSIGLRVMLMVGAEKVNPKALISTLSVSATYFVGLVACFEDPSAYVTCISASFIVFGSALNAFE